MAVPTYIINESVNLGKAILRYFFVDRHKNVAKHKQILEQIAEKKNFHPTKEPENWYKVTKQDLLDIKVTPTIVIA